MRTPDRIASVDALRGLTVAAMLIVNDAGDWAHVHPWLEHSPWNGVTPADCIFPTFLVLVGVSTSLALEPRLEKGTSRRILTSAAAWRGGRLVVLGLVLSLVAWLTIAKGHAFRPCGVLQRIGFCYLAGALVVIHLRGVMLRWALLLFLLAGYWLLLIGAGPLDPDVNLADRIDAAILGNHAYVYDPRTRLARDPEGLLSTVPAVASVLIGIQAGAWLRSDRTRTLLGAAAALLALGAAWSIVFPFNKSLWSSSFVLWTAGWALLLVALLHALIDVRGWPAVGRRLGVNAITAYAVAWLAACLLGLIGFAPALYAPIAAAAISAGAPLWVPSAVYAAAFAAAVWLLIACIDARGWKITI